jgi:intracellular sulfur oxidation DsrE/DsrF family protein
MKRKFFLSFCFLAFSFCLYAQARPYNVVFDLTSKDTTDQKNVIRWIKGISGSDPAAKLEVVLYGQSLDMVTKNKSVLTNDIMELTANKNISFKVCATAMKRHNLDKTQLLPGVETVPDGIYEIITKQGEGWGYIKVAH